MAMTPPAVPGPGTPAPAPTPATPPAPPAPPATAPRWVIPVIVALAIVALAATAFALTSDGGDGTPTADPVTTTTAAPAPPTTAVTTPTTAAPAPTTPPTTATPSGTPGGTESGNNPEGHPGPTTAQAKEATGVDVQRLGEEASAFVWRGIPATTTATCPVGWICTFDIDDASQPDGIDVGVYLGNGQQVSIHAATWRWIDGYPVDDKVNRPCDLLAAELGFADSEDPTFQVALPPDAGYTCS